MNKYNWLVYRLSSNDQYQESEFIETVLIETSLNLGYQF